MSKNQTKPNPLDTNDSAWAKCSTCGYYWPKGMHGGHRCSDYLAAKLVRAKWLVRQVLESLPKNRDWLNPDHELEMRLLSGTITPPTPKTSDKVDDASKKMAPFVNVAKGIPDNWPGECILRFDQRNDGSIYFSYYGINDAKDGITINQWRELLLGD